VAGTAGEAAAGRQAGATASDVPYLSVTQLKMYLRCPLQYFFRYVCHLKVPPGSELTLGRSVHEAIGDNYRQKITSAKDLPFGDVADIFSTRWEAEAKETVFLKTYFDEVAPHVQPVQVEREFLVDIKQTRLPVKGYIDLIDNRGNIIDHKTSKRSYPQDAAEKDLQLTAYAMAYRAIHGRRENGVRLDVMVRNKQPKIQQLHGQRTEAQIARFIRLAEQLDNGISSGVFYPNQGYFCTGCGYEGMCERW
jgi:putative RecB family exonuclease